MFFSKIVNILINLSTGNLKNKIGKAGFLFLEFVLHLKNPASKNETAQEGKMMGPFRKELM